MSKEREELINQKMIESEYIFHAYSEIFDLNYISLKYENDKNLDRYLEFLLNSKINKALSKRMILIQESDQNIFSISYYFLYLDLDMRDREIAYLFMQLFKDIKKFLENLRDE